MISFLTFILNIRKGPKMLSLSCLNIAKGNVQQDAYINLAIAMITERRDRMRDELVTIIPTRPATVECRKNIGPSYTYT
jgi:hypothetical protein